VLIFIGGVFLLQNTGYLPPNAWQNLWRLWPVILVLAGIELLLAHRVPWVVLAAVAALVLVVGAIATTGLSMAPANASGTVTRSIPTDLGGATQAAVTVRFGAGELNVGSLVQPAPAQLAVMTYTGPSELAPVPSYSAIGGAGRLEYETSSRSSPSLIPWFGGSGSDSMRMDVNLAPNVPIASLNVQTGATNAHMDLSNLQVSSLDMSVGAATAWTRLPEVGKTVVHISSGAATVTLEIPQGVAAQIHHKGGLSTFDIDQTRFPLVSEGLYRSPDFSTAQNTVDVSIDTGLTTIAVH
jgi:Domain of unknown function (DUF5668)